MADLIQDQVDLMQQNINEATDVPRLLKGGSTKYTTLNRHV